MRSEKNLKITFSDLREVFLNLRAKGWTLRKIAASYEHITYGDVERILNGIEPKDLHKRQELGLSIELPIPVCPVHGIVHVGKCPEIRRRPYRDLFEIPPDELRKMIEGRQPVSE